MFDHTSKKRKHFGSTFLPGGKTEKRKKTDPESSLSQLKKVKKTDI